MSARAPSIKTKIAFLSSLGSYSNPQIEKDQFLSNVSIEFPSTFLGNTKMIGEISLNLRDGLNQSAAGLYIGIRKQINK